MDIPIILDIEASGFGSGSYPIEIGVAMPDGSLHVWLIKPMEDWTHWQDSAEQVHGISRQQLLEEGWEPRQVADELNELLAGKIAYSDGWGVDRTWLALLFYEAHVLQGFKLDSIYGLLGESEWERWSEQRDEVLELTGMVPHRAGTDALVIQKTFIHLKEPATKLADNDRIITHKKTR
ncbi:hypothetical protein [Ketobacter sp.]|uniref:3'-5' exonuclease n=1 Tax=Ketobacter sp. TaxID=2083498 RepID=UPI000F168562|nr:hypothetical protein [Ketobacter sp.]RLU00261.1 MAG: hypothetical protein D9N14_07155 [Ketobacter sp.]